LKNKKAVFRGKFLQQNIAFCQYSISCYLSIGFWLDRQYLACPAVEWILPRKQGVTAYSN